MSKESEEGGSKPISQLALMLDDAQDNRLVQSKQASVGSADSRSKPLLERLKPILEAADLLGKPDPDFDMKAYLDKNYGDM